MGLDYYELLSIYHIKNNLTTQIKYTVMEQDFP
ncbi:MAG: hypothetical protein ACD_81C00080G0001, partial [uncultured bacterium]